MKQILSFADNGLIFFLDVQSQALFAMLLTSKGRREQNESLRTDVSYFLCSTRKRK